MVCKTSFSLNTTYLSPIFFPFPRFQVSLETRPRSCNLGSSSTFCAQFTNGDTGWPETYIAEAIASFLYDCQYRECNSIDIGGNLGIHAAYMLSTGTQLTYLEPQRALTDAFRRTVRANCWTDRVQIYNRGLSMNNIGSDKPFNGWNLHEKPFWEDPKQKQNVMKTISFRKLFENKHYDFMKFDLDNQELEGDFFHALANNILVNKTWINVIVAELTPSPTLNNALNTLKQRYDIYRMAHAVHSMSTRLEEWYTECFSLRSMKYLLKIDRKHDFNNIMRFTEDSKVKKTWNTNLLFVERGYAFTHVERRFGDWDMIQANSYDKRFLKCVEK